jgi:hypothetical protein
MMNIIKIPQLIFAQVTLQDLERRSRSIEQSLGKYLISPRICNLLQPTLREGLIHITTSSVLTV